MLKLNLLKNADLKTPIENPRIQRLIEQRRKSEAFFGSLESEEPTRQLFDHFLIVGAPPSVEEEKEAKPRVLFIYPSEELKLTKDEITCIPQFCFPKGFGQSPSLFDPRHVVESEFVFRLMPSGYYGVCSRCVVNPAKIPFFASERSINYLFCYCIITKNPTFSVHFTLLFYFAKLIDRIVDPAGERLHVKQEDDTTEKDLILGLVSQGNFAFLKGLKVPNIIKKEISFFYGLDKYASECVCADVELSTDMYVLIPQYLDYDELIGNFCFDILFSTLSIPNIVRVFTHVLVDESTIIYSESAEKVTFFILGFLALFHKFKLLNNIYLIIPKCFAFALQSPYPYLSGICWRPTKEYTEDKCFVNLDNDTIEKETVDISIPNSDALIKKLENILRKYSDYIRAPPTSKRKEYTEFLNNAHEFSRPLHSIKLLKTKYVFHPLIVKKIINCFVDHFYAKLADILSPYYVSDTTDFEKPVTVFDKDFFLKCVDRRYKGFYKLFVQSSIFDSYVESTIDELRNKKKMK